MSSETEWTAGGDAILYRRCTACGHVWYFARRFCPACGAGEDAVSALRSAGRGTIYARTLVTRAPSPELRALAPYLVVLVDLDEGVRIMAHGDPDLAIGDRAAARVVRFGGDGQGGGGALPHFTRLP
ncbi:MAG TPA: OB-fold domain-containing protein [Stellaceae bacterium]|jgi:uncharacterized OB-fold protein